MATTKKSTPVKSETATKPASAKAGSKKVAVPPPATPAPSVTPAPAKTVATRWVVAKPAETEMPTVKTVEAKPVAAAPVAAKPIAAKPVAAKSTEGKSTAARPVAKSKPKAEPVEAADNPKSSMGKEQRAHYVEVAAFYIAERRGFASVDPMEDWLAAEAEIDRLIASGHFAQS